MDNRKWEADAIASPPTAPVSPSAGYPTNGDPLAAQNATEPGEWWFHAVGEELRAVIVEGGLTPDISTLTQLRDAVKNISTSNAGASIQGAFKNLKASATGLSANVTVTADEIAVENASNTYKTLRAVNLTISGATSGVANGLDTGALAINTWYSVWVIWNGTTTSGLLSLSETAPTLPSGYTHKARVGWIRTDASGNKYPLGFTQYGKNIQYRIVAGTNVPTMPRLVSGVQGTVGTTLVSASISNFVPPTASRVKGILNSGGTQSQISPNSNANVDHISTIWSLNATQENHGAYDFIIESTNLYYAAAVSGAYAGVGGWEDNL